MENALPAAENAETSSSWEKKKAVTSSLPFLQNKIKREPAAYEAEFSLQYAHFEASLEVLKTKLQRPSKGFNELVMFLAQTSPCYSGSLSSGRAKGGGEKDMAPCPQRLVGLSGGSLLARLGGVAVKFADLLIDILQRHLDVLHPTTRKTLVAALIMLRNRGQITCFKLLPTWFFLFGTDDKQLRSRLYCHVVKDINKLHKSDKSHEANAQLKTYLYGRIRDTQPFRARRALAILVELYRRRVWTDDRTVNVIASATLSPDKKVCVAAAIFLLGFKAAASEALDSDSEGEDDVATSQTIGKRVVGAKPTQGRVRKLAKARSAIGKLARRRARRKAGTDSHGSFAAMDMLYDPQALSEQLLQRTASHQDSFTVRLVLLNLVSRLVGRHQLLLLNLYPLLHRYLNPHQKQIAKILAILGQATHELVPPQELEPVIKLIMDRFVSDHQSPEVIAVGINAIRLVATRNPLCLSKEALADLVEFRSSKQKSVMMASRSLMNLFRDLYPTLLHPRLRGKNAAIAVSANEDNRRQYGEMKVTTSEEADALNFVEAKDKGNREATDEEEGDDSSPSEGESGEDLGEEDEERDPQTEEEEDEEEEEEGCANSDAPDEAFPQVSKGEEDREGEGQAEGEQLENEVAKKSVKTEEEAKQRRSVKRKRNEQSEGSEDDNGNGFEDSEDEMGGFTEAVDPEDLVCSWLRRKRARENMRQKQMQRNGVKGKLPTQRGTATGLLIGGGKRRQRKMAKGIALHGGNRAMPSHSKPNAVKSRNKPMMMRKQSRQANHKRQETAAAKVAHVRAHIRNLKKKTGKKQRRRRG